MVIFRPIPKFGMWLPAQCLAGKGYFRLPLYRAIVRKRLISDLRPGTAQVDHNVLQAAH